MLLIQVQKIVVRVTCIVFGAIEKFTVTLDVIFPELKQNCESELINNNLY